MSNAKPMLQPSGLRRWSNSARKATSSCSAHVSARAPFDLDVAQDNPLRVQFDDVPVYVVTLTRPGLPAPGVEQMEGDLVRVVWGAMEKGRGSFACPGPQRVIVLC